MKILVTGGAGFIGSHLVKMLLNEGHTVEIFDDLSKSSMERVKELQNLGASFTKGDIRDLKKLKNILKKDFELVVHLAAKTRVIDSINFPDETNDVNVTGTLKILVACVDLDIKNFIVASSGAVYGDAKKLPLTEELPMIPISPYGASKASIEHYLQSFSHSYDMNCIALRFSNVYGIGQSPEYAGVITKFMKNIQKNEPITIFGDGTNTRDFVSVDDVTHGINMAILKINGKKGSSYNIATGIKTSINQLAELLLEISGKTVKIIHADARKGEIEHSFASIEKAKNELNYTPKIALREGMTKMLNSNKI
jgi:UDP-glucose 4-epimerase